MYQMAVKYSKWMSNIPRYTNIFHSSALQKYAQFGNFGLKIFHLATLEGIAGG
jgi:hypothetical protein